MAKKKPPAPPLPTLHPRHVPVEEARRELAEFVVGWWRRHELTRAEQLMLLAEQLHDEMAACVRLERKT